MSLLTPPSQGGILELGLHSAAVAIHPASPTPAPSPAPSLSQSGVSTVPDDYRGREGEGKKEGYLPIPCSLLILSGSVLACGGMKPTQGPPCPPQVGTYPGSRPCCCLRCLTAADRCLWMIEDKHREQAVCLAVNQGWPSRWAVPGSAEATPTCWPQLVQEACMPHPLTSQGANLRFVCY